MQNYYSSTDVQKGIIQFYNKIASRLMNGKVLDFLNVFYYSFLFFFMYSSCLDNLMGSEVSCSGKNHNYYAISSNGITLCLAYPSKHNMVTIR